jgi:hypothetical protein
MTGTAPLPDVVDRLATLIVRALAAKPSLLAVAVLYETGQPAPALYVATETPEHCEERLRSLAAPERFARDLAALQEALAFSPATSTAR